MLIVLALLTVALAVSISIPNILLSLYFQHKRNANSHKRVAVLHSLRVPSPETKKLVGFFHPFCNAGGGGERVLWTAVALMQRTSPNVVSIIYSGDGDAGKDEILGKVKSRFNIVLDPSTVHFVFLKERHMVEDSYWPRFTLLGQSIGSMILAYEAMSELMPDLYIDTMGYAFSFHVVRALASIPVGAYVHYPTISTDMLARVKSRRQWHTNTTAISSSATLSGAKLLYYRLFMWLYANALRRASFLMVNSSWTKNHIDSILSHKDLLVDILTWTARLPWNFAWAFSDSHVPPKTAQIVYPPCETGELRYFPLSNRERVVLSVAQFRPEKEHSTQLHAFNKLLSNHPEFRSGPLSVKLVLIGGSRNEEDQSRVDSLKKLAQDLNIAENVQFVVNAPHATVLSWLSRASIGLSTMIDEHFGINVVEFLAAGVIPVVHASGGPLNDIVVPYEGEPTGYHATSPETFAERMYEALSLSEDDAFAMRSRGRAWAQHKFSREGFEEDWEASGWRQWLVKS